MSEPSSIHIKAMYPKYAEVLERFGEKEIEKRYARLLKSAQEFIEKMDYRDHVGCNESMLMLVVLGYYSDIMRLKDFHEIECENNPKVFAYETSWLLKRKPLQLKNDHEDDLKYFFCNEQFAFSQIMFWLNCQDNNKGNVASGVEAMANQDLAYFSEALFYHLKYRNYDAPTLELMLVSFTAGRKYQTLISPFTKA